MKILVLGNGLSCQIFLHCLKKSNLQTEVLILEKKNNTNCDEIIDDVPFYFNELIDDFIDNLESINICMGIYDNEKIFYSGTEELSKKYSIKVVGQYTGNTIKFVQKNKKGFVYKNSNGKI